MGIESKKNGHATSRLRTLVLTAEYPHQASYYDDWRDAFDHSPLFECSVVNIIGASPQQLGREIDEYDAVIVLHSCNADILDAMGLLVGPLSERKRAKLLTFVGNEYNNPHVTLSAKLVQLGQMRPDIIATQLLEEAGHHIYDGLGARVISLPHALNPDAFLPTRIGPRPMDIGYRGFRYPPYLGDSDRNRLVSYFGTHADGFGIATDIDWVERFSREKWAHFLLRCKGTIATEAGSWFLSRDDSLMIQVEEFLNRQRGSMTIGMDSAVRRFVRMAPLPVKRALAYAARKGPIRYAPFEDEIVEFDALYDRFFKDAPRCPVYPKAVSSRHFDAIGTKTCLIMFEGRYNDILVAGRDYLALARDFSNIEDVIARFRDPVERARITDVAYEGVMESHTYAHRAEAAHAALCALH